MQEFDRSLLNKDEFEELKPNLLKAFAEFKPRSAFISKSKDIERINNLNLEVYESPNIVMKSTRFCDNKVTDIAEFSTLFANHSKYDLLMSKFKCIEDYAAEYIEKCETSFITFSTNITGAKLGVQHLHPLMNGDRCNVWSFSVPLYLDSESLDNHKFWYSWKKELFPPRYYVDYERIKKEEIKFNDFGLPTNGHVFSIQFDGSRTPHYIDYTPHLYAWFVLDGVTYKDPNYAKLKSQFSINLI